MMPSPQLPDPNTEQGKLQLAFSMLTCAQQIDSKIFAYMKHIRPRRALILDEQKQTVGTSRCSCMTAPAAARRPTRRRACCRIS
jgi:hypothetical protein